MRFAIVGAGMMGREHLRNLAIVEGARVVGVADPQAASLEAARATLGEWASGVAIDTGIDRMLDACAPDAVIVASPNFTHHAVMQGLFDRPVHILCEKPLATNAADARDIAARAARRRHIVWTGMEYRFMPPLARFIDEVHAGAAGRLVRVAMTEHRFPFLPKVGDWNRFSRNTGGTMVEKCCHFFDLMRLITRSDAVRVFCSGGADVNHRDERYGGEIPDIIDNAYTIVEFANGMRAMLDLCMFAEGAEEQEVISAVGDAARLDVGIPSGVITRSPRAPGQPRQTERRRIDVDARVLGAGTHHGATFHQLEAFIAAARGEAPVAVTAADGLAAVLIGLAAERSAAQGRAVALAEI